ncbi:MAG: histidinol-phosphate transaminase [Gemmatimonadaceae bacterium]
MAFDPLALVRPHLAALAPGEPPPPIDEAAARLDANENALGPSPRALAALVHAAQFAHRYPDSGGLRLRERIAGLDGVTPEHVALGAGSDGLIEKLVHLLIGPGDEVVAAHPSFVTYAHATRLHGGTFVPVPGNGIDHDLDAMRRAVTPRTKLLFVCDPNNPTGSHLAPGAFEGFLAQVPLHVMVVLDEAYREYVEDAPDTRALLALERPLVLLRTFSKIHALAGLRIGYVIARPETAALFRRVALTFDVNGPAQAAALAALDDTAHVESVRAFARAGREALHKDLGALGIRTFPSFTNFVLADFGRDCRPLVHALRERGVLVRAMTSFGMAPGFARIGVGTPGEHARLVEALSDLLRGAA